jgi:PIN domain nuclease of toxin-antitoxin system
MRCLMDTHIFIWWILDHPKLPRSSRQIIADSTTELFFSSASAWEIIIKSTIGKLSLPENPTGWIRKHLDLNRINALPITLEHALMLHELPNLHKDPFDRIMVAQARCEDLTILTDDEWIPKYAVKTA